MKFSEIFCKNAYGNSVCCDELICSIIILKQNKKEKIYARIREDNKNVDIRYTLHIKCKMDWKEVTKVKQDIRKIPDFNNEYITPYPHNLLRNCVVKSLYNKANRMSVQAHIRIKVQIVKSN